MNKKIIKGMIVLLILIIGSILIISKSLSKYETRTEASVNSNIAFYLTKAQYMTKNVKISEIEPSNVPKVYTFSVSNTYQNKTSEVDISYILKIITTTNLPLRYELYMNEDYQLSTSTNLISSENTVVAQDEYGTYFQTFTFEEEELYFSTAKTNEYTLLVYYDLESKDVKYQDTIESIKLEIDSSQIIE